MSVIPRPFFISKPRLARTMLYDSTTNQKLHSVQRRMWLTGTHQQLLSLVAPSKSRLKCDTASAFSEA